MYIIVMPFRSGLRGKRDFRQICYLAPRFFERVAPTRGLSSIPWRSHTARTSRVAAHLGQPVAQQYLAEEVTELPLTDLVAAERRSMVHL